MLRRSIGRAPRGTLLLVLVTAAALALAFAGVEGGLLDFGVGGAPHVRIDGPRP